MVSRQRTARPRPVFFEWRIMLSRTSRAAKNYSFGAELRRTGRDSIRDATLVELVWSDFDHPGDFSRYKNRVAARRVGYSDLDGGTLKILLLALETESAFGHVFARDHVVGKAGAANAGLVADLGSRVLAPVVQRNSRFAIRWRGICRASL